MSTRHNAVCGPGSYTGPTLPSGRRLRGHECLHRLYVNMPACHRIVPGCCCRGCGGGAISSRLVSQRLRYPVHPVVSAIMSSWCFLPHAAVSVLQGNSFCHDQCRCQHQKRITNSVFYFWLRCHCFLDAARCPKSSLTPQGDIMSHNFHVGLYFRQSKEVRKYPAKIVNKCAPPTVLCQNWLSFSMFESDSYVVPVHAYCTAVCKTLLHYLHVSKPREWVCEWRCG